MAAVDLAEEGVAATNSLLTMNSKNQKTAAATLATATCALLGTAVTVPVHAQEEPEWEFDTALLYYGESDNRVEDVSLNFLALRNFVDDRILTLSLGVDSLTGATPVGAQHHRPRGAGRFPRPAER